MIDGRIQWMLEGSFQARQAFPVYGDAVAVDYSKESGQEFFRPKFSGKLKFIGKDYADIVADPFSRKFIIIGRVWQNGGWYLFMQGHFFKTDCEFDEDGQTVTVTPTMDDDYAGIIAGLDKEFNLVSLAPAIQPVKIDKRPIIQIYNRGDDEITCILAGMWWTQPANAEDGPAPLVNTYNFKHISTNITGIFSVLNESGDWSGAPGQPANMYSKLTAAAYGDTSAKNGYFIRGEQYGTDYYRFFIVDETTGVNEWHSGLFLRSDFTNPCEIPMTGRDASYPDLVLVYRRVDIYARIITDATSILGVQTRALPTTDITDNSRNYSFCAPYDASDEIHIDDGMTATPTELGQWDNGLYYVQWLPFVGRAIPVCRNCWEAFSVWYGWGSAGNFDELAEEDGRSEFVLRDAYPLNAVISALLGAIGAGVTFNADSAYSEFFYGPFIRREGDFQVFITPKTNILTSDYEQAAQRGNITLKEVFDMLRDCFRCYWFVEGGKLRIEHIRYFMNGRSYTGTPGIGVDLTGETYVRTGKTVATGQSQYKYNKPETYGRIEFGWMDAETPPFDGKPIDIIADWVEEGRVEEVRLSNFSSDVDWLLANPSEASKDGFVLLLASPVADGYKLPYIEGDTPGAYYQNGFAAFDWLYRFYRYDLPAPDYERAGVPGTAAGTKRIKTQDVTFPSALLPDLYQLIETNLGTGVIEKLSVSLVDLTCKATLTYGTT